MAAPSTPSESTSAAVTRTPCTAATRTPTVAVLALQGAFAEHKTKLARLGCNTLELRQASDLQQPFDALVLPGGESTVQAKLLRELGMIEVLRARIAAGLPVLGTRAGLILLAEHVISASDGRRCEPLPTSALAPARVSTSAPARTSAPGDVTTVEGFNTLPITVLRNGYGRQLGSFAAHAPLADTTEPETTHTHDIPLVFIRAPRITSLSPGVEPLIEFDGEPVAVRFGNQIGCTFHPELTDDDTIYRLLLNSI